MAVFPYSVAAIMYALLQSARGSDLLALSLDKPLRAKLRLYAFLARIAIICVMALVAKIAMFEAEGTMCAVRGLLAASAIAFAAQVYTLWMQRSCRVLVEGKAQPIRLRLLKRGAFNSATFTVEGTDEVFHPTLIGPNCSLLAACDSGQKLATIGYRDKETGKLVAVRTAFGVLLSAAL